MELHLWALQLLLLKWTWDQETCVITDQTRVILYHRDFVYNDCMHVWWCMKAFRAVTLWVHFRFWNNWIPDYVYIRLCGCAKFPNREFKHVPDLWQGNLGYRDYIVLRGSCFWRKISFCINPYMCFSYFQHAPFPYQLGPWLPYPWNVTTPYVTLWGLVDGKLYPILIVLSLSYGSEASYWCRQ